MFKSSLIFSMVLVLLMSCSSKKDSIIDSPDIQLSRLMITSSELPTDVDEIIGTLTNPDYDPIPNGFTITNDTAYCLFEDVPVGVWNLKVSAFFEGELTYQGSATVEVIEDIVTYVSVYMKRVQGVGIIYVGLTWDTPEYQIYNYNFNDNDLSGWYGTASAAIVDKKLHLYSIQGFKYHTIAYNSSPHFTEGNIEVDILPQNGRFNFETKGATKGNGILEWGIFVQFRHDSLFVSQHNNNSDSLEFTNFLYTPNTWYKMRFSFDNEAGEKGKFDFWITPLINGNTEVYLGEFDYKARYGRLEGVNQFVLAVGDPDGSTTKEGVFDNIEFSVK